MTASRIARPDYGWSAVRSASILRPPAVEIVTAGGLGGMAYWVVIFPVDVVKSAMQTDAIVKVERKYPDMLTTTQVRLRALHVRHVPVQSQSSTALVGAGAGTRSPR